MKNTINKPFIAFIVTDDDKEWTYEAILVNPTNTDYERVESLTGAHMSIDDDLLETSKSVRELGVLPPQSSIRIEGSDVDGLEFRAWFHLDLYERGSSKPWQVWFGLPGPLTVWSNYKPEPLPVLKKEGQVIELLERNGPDIPEETDGMDMGSKYHSFSKESSNDMTEEQAKQPKEEPSEGLLSIGIIGDNLGPKPSEPSKKPGRIPLFLVPTEGKSVDQIRKAAEDALREKGLLDEGEE